MTKRAMTTEAKELKAQKILDKAAEMFIASDYDKIKISDIAKEMDMSNGILFVYFKTKETLFFHLLCREYEKRFSRLIELAKEKRISHFEDFKNLILDELLEIVDTNPLYIRLESMRTAILEKNIDAETLLKLKTNLYVKTMEMVSIICESNVVTQMEVIDILQAEASIITGCKLSATLPEEVVNIIKNHGLGELIRDFRKDVMTTMQCYLNGYSRSEN